MRFYVGVTDNKWFGHLSALPTVEDVNFWRPSGEPFKVLPEGGLFLFKLHAPLNFIAGGGFLSKVLYLPLQLAWDAFGQGNGVASQAALSTLITKYRASSKKPAVPNPVLTCIILSEPFFWPREQWIPAPASFGKPIVTGKRYFTEEAEGLALYQAVAERLKLSEAIRQDGPATQAIIETPAYGTPYLVKPRLGQGAFRALVTEAYGRRCSVTGEKTLPVLEAAHVQPYAQGGPHALENGLLLRSDLHRLYDTGYITVDPDERRLIVSGRIRAEFQNGRHYYELQNAPLRSPETGYGPVSTERLRFHAQHVYLGS